MRKLVALLMVVVSLVALPAVAAPKPQPLTLLAGWSGWVQSAIAEVFAAVGGRPTKPARKPIALKVAPDGCTVDPLGRPPYCN